MSRERERRRQNPDALLKSFSQTSIGIDRERKDTIIRLARRGRAAIRKLSEVLEKPTEVTFSKERAPILIQNGIAYHCGESKALYSERRERGQEVYWYRLNDEGVVYFCRKIAELGELGMRRSTPASQNKVDQWGSYPARTKGSRM